MDRNTILTQTSTNIVRVALRKESVDRNRMEIDGASYDVWSLSARRAWIEIIDDLEPSTTRRLSLSARRAWIEIPIVPVELTTLVSRSPQGERG